MTDPKNRLGSSVPWCFSTLLDPVQSLVRAQLGNTESGMVDTKLYLTIAAIVAILYALAFLV
jgi:hypothetical protein